MGCRKRHSAVSQVEQVARSCVVGRLAGYERDPGDHAMTLWFEHGPQVRVTRNADIVQWYIPKQVEVTGTGYNNAVVTQEQS